MKKLCKVGANALYKHGAVRNFASGIASHEIENKFGFNRPKKAASASGTLKEYKRHIFVSSTQHFSEWPKELSKEGNEFIVSLSKSIKDRFSDETRVTTFYDKETNKDFGTYIELFPDGLLIPNLSVSSIPELIQFLADNSQNSLNPRPLTGNFLYICSHQSRDMRCGYCGPILVNLLQEKSNALKGSQPTSIRGCSHVGGHEYAGNVIACRRVSNSPIKSKNYAVDWFGYVAPENVLDVLNFSQSTEAKPPSSNSPVFPLWRGSAMEDCSTRLGVYPRQGFQNNIRAFPLISVAFLSVRGSNMLKALSPSERTFLEEGVAQNLRTDGRSLMDFRNFYLETGIISQTNGSARLKLQDTDVLVGVKLETGDPDPQAPDRGIINISVECCPSASPEFEGKGAVVLNNELARYLERIMKNSASFDLTQLCIIPGKLCWILYVDAMVLDSGGNLFDAISIATRAALYNTAIPQVEVNLELGEFELVDDPDAFKRLDIDSVPICVTFTKIGTNYVVDATLEEELCMTVRLTVAVNKKGNICGIQKGGHGGLEPSSMYEMLSSARKIGQQILDKLDNNLKSKTDQNKHKIGFLS